jgi:Acetyl xylan esterase (AXE1)
LILSVAVSGLLVALGTDALAADLPRTVQSAPCRKPPTVDGIIGEDEWREAPPIEFDMPVLQTNPQAVSRRACRLRVMNSGNALYLALRIPDEVVNKSLAPLDIDFALLAFCRGKELAAGDDRKAVGPGIYVDKYFVAPGKTEDDKAQHGKGALAHAGGFATIEWALPLDSGDAQDLQAKQGDAVRFNIAYFDAFQPELKGTQIGAAYEGGLDQAANWGTLQLAAGVPDDDGAAFKGPAWVAELVAGFQTVPASRLRVIDSVLLPSSPQPVARVFVEYKYRNPKGEEAVGKAKLYLPASAQLGTEKFWLYYSAGYELDDGSALGQASRGAVVVTPRELEANPLVRTINPDAALLHIARSLPFVDDARVVVAGGSAGGYATLMLAAETFPVAGAAPDVPPINWGYNAAFFLQKERQPAAAAATDPNAPKVPFFDVIVPIVKQALGVYGNDTDGPAYFANSPLAHLPTITCPVSVYWTTADMLVPIDQVGSQWIRPLDVSTFPAGFTMDREKLASSAEGRKRLTDLLPEREYELFLISEETVKRQLADSTLSKMPVDLDDNPARQWSITILDEGAPTPLVGHTKYPVARTHRAFLDRVTASKISPDQLTPAKLERLMDRYAGREWLPAGLVHLDDAESERADVIRGLTTYVAAGAENARMFAELYTKLPPARQVLPKEIEGKLRGK